MPLCRPLLLITSETLKGCEKLIQNFFIVQTWILSKGYLQRNQTAEMKFLLPEKGRFIMYIQRKEDIGNEL